MSDPAVALRFCGLTWLPLGSNELLRAFSICALSLGSACIGFHLPLPDALRSFAGGSASISLSARRSVLARSRHRAVSFAGSTFGALPSRRFATPIVLSFFPRLNHFACANIETIITCASVGKVNAAASLVLRQFLTIQCGYPNPVNPHKLSLSALPL